MDFNEHSRLAGRHAFLGPSTYHWLRYTPEKLILRYQTHEKATRGVDLHNLAHEMIRLKIRLEKKGLPLNMYVNDGIGFRMTCEQALYYSENCFGTADTISFRDGELRIHDYKSGVTPTSMDQLVIYAALFLLEYEMRPHYVDTILRIYQDAGAPRELRPTNEHLEEVMAIIVKSDQIIEEWKEAQK